MTNDHPPSAYVGPIYEFRITGKSTIEGMPDYDFTFRSPDRAEAAGHAYATASMPQFTSVLTDIAVAGRTVQYPHWKSMSADDLLEAHNPDQAALNRNQPTEPARPVDPLSDSYDKQFT